MKTIILAAGEGKRLYPLTLDRPKAMLEVGGRTLIERALDSLSRAGIRDPEIIILAGHKSQKLKTAAPECLFIHNQLYDSTNNIYSLWLARKELAGEEFMLLNSDVLFAPELAQKILTDGRESVLMVDDVNPLVEEEMRVMVDGEGRVTAIAKTIDAQRSAGEYIGLARFGAAFSQALFKRMDEMIQAGKTNVWYENAIAEILGDQPIYLLSTQGLPWIEIDTHEDLARAAEIDREIENMEV
jgi:choline kinase